MALEVKLLYFAKGREVVGKSEEILSLEAGSTTANLWDILIQRYPKLKDIMNSCVFAVNQQYVPKDASQELHSGDEVAIIPPLSGG
jgi:molybdopterin converting factor subunit 1